MKDFFEDFIETIKDYAKDYTEALKEVIMIVVVVLLVLIMMLGFAAGTFLTLICNFWWGLPCGVLLCILLAPLVSIILSR